MKYECTRMVKNTMHNKFSNCFVWVSPSTSDLKFHLLSQRYKRRSSDKIFHLKKYRITKRSGRAKVTFNFKTSGNVGISDHWGKPKPFSNDCLVTENQKSTANGAIFLNFLREIKDQVYKI